MVINISNVSKQYADRTLFENANLSVEKGEVVGLIGANGVGKTTLFNIITGKETPDTGMVIKSPFATVGYLEQHVCAESDKTCYEETVSIFDNLSLIEEELKNIREALNGPEANNLDLIERQETLLEKYHEHDGLTYVSLTHSVLSGLGFTDEEQNLPVKSLSGGQKAKIGLAKLLLQKPDLMLLDEPTNHLDIESVAWLEKFIQSSHITTIVISHDRYFLDRVATQIAEITTRKVYVTKGNYSRHMQLKAERDLAEERNYNNVMAEVKRLEGVIEQQKRWNREKNIKTAESKQKQIDRLTDGLEAPEHERFDFSFHFSPDTLSGEDVLDVVDARMDFPGNTLYSGVSFSIKRGEHIFIVGENGIGKTTLIKQIMRRTRGIKFGVGVTVGYFDQHQLNLNLANTAFDEIHDAYPKMTDTEVRKSLAVFGFKGDKVFDTLQTMSGGERAKVSLCKLMLRKCNFLILDEPTNHLDIYSMAALEDALKAYESTLLIISHDRYFINSLADKVVELKKDGADVYVGNYDNYIEAKEKTVSEDISDAPKKEMGAGGKSYNEQKLLRRERTKIKTALRKAEELIAELEEKIELKNEELNSLADASDYEKTFALTNELAELEERLAGAMEEWENLAEQSLEFED
ncbi:MAG: ABC-F family ATP-binding cassette domain-containing protein [Clostridia bacterium]|nr:ABC-F family ATP-binding cassette domain-containing protein [Clostridia bacterium]